MVRHWSLANFKNLTNSFFSSNNDESLNFIQGLYTCHQPTNLPRLRSNINISLKIKNQKLIAAILHLIKLTTWLLRMSMYIFFSLLTHILSLICFYFPWEHQKISEFLIFSGGTEKDQWHDQWQVSCRLSNSMHEKMIKDSEMHIPSKSFGILCSLLIDGDINGCYLGCRSVLAFGVNLFWIKIKLISAAFGR